MRSAVLTSAPPLLDGAVAARDLELIHGIEEHLAAGLVDQALVALSRLRPTLNNDSRLLSLSVRAHLAAGQPRAAATAADRLLRAEPDSIAAKLLAAAARRACEQSRPAIRLELPRGMHARPG